MFTRFIILTRDRITRLAQHESNVAVLLLAAQVLTRVHTLYVTMVIKLPGALSTFQSDVTDHLDLLTAWLVMRTTKDGIESPG